MLYLGFILSVVAYAVTIFMFIGYVILFCLKMNRILERFISAIFLISLVVLMTLSWSLIFMNGGFHVNLNIRIDYSYVLIPSVPVVIVYEVLDTLQRKKIEHSDKWYINAVRYLLPVLTGILFFVCTLIFYFNCNYFMYLNM